MNWLIAAFALTGCDRLLDLRKVDPPTFDAVVEGEPPPDTLISCVPDGTHDEDKDMLPDSCDLCPTVTSANLDMDGDGLGDECDPRSNGNDKIDAFYSFVDRSGLKTTGTVTTKPDSFLLDNGTIETQISFIDPEQMTVAVNLASSPATATIVLSLNASGSNKASCEIAMSACPTGAAVCIFAAQNGITSNTPTSLTPAEVETLTLYRTDDGVVRCGINDVTSMHSPPLPGPMPNGAVQIAVPLGPITVRNLIIYNTVP